MNDFRQKWRWKIFAELIYVLLITWNFRFRKANNKEDRFTMRHEVHWLICHACKLIYFRTRKSHGHRLQKRSIARWREFLEHMLNVLRNISPTGAESLLPYPPLSARLRERAKIVLLSDPGRWFREGKRGPLAFI